MSSLIRSKISEPYAEALLDLAKSTKTVNEIKEDLNTVSRFLSESSDFKGCLENLCISKDAKKVVIKNVLSGQIDQNMLNFLFLLIDRNRTEILEDVYEQYVEILNNQESIKLALITSSIKLTEEQLVTIAKRLKIITGASTIKVAFRVDPQLIAGFTIEIGSEIIDTSIRGQLNQIRSLLGIKM
jgi:F-type H+-transporting ATPase subunit delta